MFFFVLLLITFLFLFTVVFFFFISPVPSPLTTTSSFFLLMPLLHLAGRPPGGQTNDNMQFFLLVLWVLFFCSCQDGGGPCLCPQRLCDNPEVSAMEVMQINEKTTHSSHVLTSLGYNFTDLLIFFLLNYLSLWCPQVFQE